MKTFSLTVITPEKVVYEQSVYEVVIPTEEGVLGILPGHVPLVALLKTGPLKIRESKDASIYTVYALSGGIVEVRSDDHVIVMPDRTEHADEIDIVRAQEAYDRLLQQKEDMRHSVDFARFESLMEKELNRIHIAREWGKGDK